MCFFLQAEDGIRYLVRSRGLGDVYKRQLMALLANEPALLDRYCRRPVRVPAALARMDSALDLSLIHI